MAAWQCAAEVSGCESVQHMGKFHAGFAKSSAQVWVRSERVKLHAKALKSEQGFGRGCASFAWAEPCQASRGVEHAGGIKVDIRTKGTTVK